MKTAICILMSLAFIAGTTEVFQQLKIDVGRAQEYITNTVENGNLSYPSACRQIAASARLEIVKAILPFTKEYTQSADFKNRYTKWWRENQPPKPLSIEDRKARRVAEQAKSTQEADQTVQNMKQQIATTTDPQIKKALQDGLDTYEKMKKQTQTPEMKKMLEQSQQTAEKMDKDDYMKEMDVYNHTYADWIKKQTPDYLIKQHLQQYLTTVATVDFNAKTVSGPGGKFFASHDYQSKPSDWKLIYRAGKDVNEYGKIFAQQWLTELK